MAGNDRSGRQIKSYEKRDRVINLRIGESDLRYLDELCEIRRRNGKAFCSRIDILLIALQALDLKQL